MKPIPIEDLRHALEKFNQQETVIHQKIATQLSTLFPKLIQQKKHRCLIKKGNHFEFLNVSDIIFANSEKGLTFLHTFKNKRHLYTHTITGLMEQLDVQIFFQINRSQIVNINAIKKLYPYFNNRLHLELVIPTPIELLVSRPKMQAFKLWMDN